MRKIIQNRNLKKIQWILLGFASLFVVIAVTLCIVHISWMSTGVQINATYNEENNTLTYPGNNKICTVICKMNPIKIDENNRVTIYYSKNNPEKYYMSDQISRVFIFSGIGFACLIACFIIMSKINKLSTRETLLLQEGKFVRAKIVNVEKVLDNKQKLSVILHLEYTTADDVVLKFDSINLYDKKLVETMKCGNFGEVYYMKNEPSFYIVTAYEES